MRAHVIAGGKVVNTIVVDKLDVIHGLITAENGGKIGDLWDGATFTMPVPARDIQAEILALEMQQTKRREREALAGTDGGWMVNLNAQIVALRSLIV